MVIKVSCACGCRYSFEVQPLNGQMPVACHCPKCGLEGTQKANAILAQVLPKPVTVPAAASGVLAGIPLPPDEPAPAAAPMAIPVPPSAPAAVTPPAAPKRPPAIALPPTPSAPAISVPAVPAAVPAPAPAMAAALPPPPPPAAAMPPPPPPPAPSGLTVKRRAPEESHAASPASAPAGEAPAMSAGLKVKGVAPSAHAPAASAGPAPAPAEAPAAEAKIANPHDRKAYIPKDAPEPSFPRGMLGAAIGTVVGCLIWYAVFYFGEINFGFFAFVPALLAGILGRMMAREDNTWIGVTAAVFTVIGIFGTHYAIAAREMDQEFGDLAETLLPPYDVRLAEATEAAAAKTDDEIRTFLQNRNRKLFEKFAEKGEKYQPEGVSKNEVDAFKMFEQKQLQDFADGKPSREEYEKQISSAKQAGTWFTRILTAVKAVIAAGLFGIISLVMAVSIAYRTGSG